MEVATSAELQLLIGFLSLASALVGLYASLRQAKAARIQAAPCNDRTIPQADRHPSSARSAAALVRWYDHPGWILFLLFAFCPAGLFALARSRMISASWKKALFAGVGILMVLAMLGA